MILKKIKEAQVKEDSEVQDHRVHLQDIMIEKADINIKMINIGVVIILQLDLLNKVLFGNTENIMFLKISHHQ